MAIYRAGENPVLNRCGSHEGDPQRRQLYERGSGQRQRHGRCDELGDLGVNTGLSPRSHQLQGTVPKDPRQPVLLRVLQLKLVHVVSVNKSI